LSTVYRRERLPSRTLLPLEGIPSEVTLYVVMTVPLLAELELRLGITWRGPEGTTW
jgi:hypothetical protein